ncbi:MAG TPA: O-antigen ligase family protein [Hyphomicrobiales bacterium]
MVYLLAGMTLVVIGGLLLVDPASITTVLIAPAVFMFLVILWSAIRGHRFGVMALVFIAVFLIDATFRRREFSDKSLDYQVMMKVGLWLTIAAVSVVHFRRWAHIILLPSNIPWIIFLCWLCLTAAVSEVPAYSAMTAFSIYSFAIFCAFIFNNYDRVEIFAVMVAAIVVFCIVSIVVYFAIPDLGHFIYWDNDVRFLSARLSGIAGSANNLGRLAAFGLILCGLYFREFRRYHRLFVPLSFFIMSLALLMTNSRTSIAMVIAVLLGAYVLNWRRFYLVVLMVTIAIAMALIVVPSGEQALTVISRSGNVEEVSSMTGRTNIWHAVLVLSAERPIAGYGYASSIFVLPEHERLVGFAVGHAHNLILQLLLTTGWTGVVLFIGAVLSVGTRAVYTGNRVVLALLAILVLNGITEASGFTTLANICSLAFTIAITLPPHRDRSYEDNPAYQC